MAARWPGHAHGLVLAAAVLSLLCSAAAVSGPALPPEAAEALDGLAVPVLPLPKLPPEVAERVRALAAAAARARPAAAVGPQRAPSAPTSQPARAYAAAPAPATGNSTFVSAGDWRGRARHAAVKCDDPPGDPPGQGRCTNRCDQLYNTCPLPTDLPKGKVPAKGGPVGSDPPVMTPALLTSGEVDDAVSKGLLKKAAAAHPEADIAAAISGATTYAAPSGRPAASSPARVNTNSSATIEAISINAGDSWAIRNTNCQIAPIHAILNRYNKFIMIDRIFFAADNQTPNPYGYLATEYDVATNTFRNLSSGITSNSWCSAGQIMYGGSVVDLGGGGDEPTPNPAGGGDSIRVLPSCNNNACQFAESRATAQRLLTYRWYPTSLNNWDGRLLVASGQDLDQGTGEHGDTYELWPRQSAAEGNLANLALPINLDTSPSGIGPTNYGPRPLYPHMHLLPTYETLVVSTNQWWMAYLFGASQSYFSKGPGFLDPRWADGGTPVSYPGFGTSFMLPLSPPYGTATVVFCGATWGYNSINAYVDPDCAVITPTDANPVSSRATGLTMINKRIMPYCVTMLCGNVACMMGAASGFSGYYSAINPQLQVDLLNTTAMPLRFVTGATATVPRLYHSVASLVVTGAIITAGSNPQGQYAFQSDPSTGVFPSELRVEYYYPWYFKVTRPVLTSVTGAVSGAQGPSYPHGNNITVSAQLTALTNTQKVAVINPGFSTHGQLMSQRYVFLACTCPTPTARAVGSGYVAVVTCSCTIPGNYAVTPAGDYLVTLLDGGVPSQAQWISIGP